MRRPLRLIARPGCVLMWVVGTLICLPWLVARADTLTMRNGMQFSGNAKSISSLNSNPQQNAAAAATGIEPIVVIDDSLRRTFVPLNQVRAKAAENFLQEGINLDKRVANSTKRVGTVGPVIKITPWDEQGNRVYTMATDKGQVSVIQGMTKVTPLYTKVESLQVERPYPYVWDMRVATNSIPRDVLSRVLLRQIDPRKPAERLRIVSLYTKADLYEEAFDELDKIIKEFGLKDLEKQKKELLQLSANRLLREIEQRRDAGQHQLAIQMLQTFPEKGVAGETLIKVRDLLQNYAALKEQGDNCLQLLKQHFAAIGDPKLRNQLQPVYDEITTELNVNTLDRMADYLRLANDPLLTPDVKFSLAVSAWLLGSGAGIENLAVSQSLVEVRDLVRTYLRSNHAPDHEQILEQLKKLEGSSLPDLAKIVAHMKPPVDTAVPQQGTPGFFKLTVPGLTGEGDFTYYVQLPPEYDPYRRYSCVVTLGGPGLSAPDQMQWWTGLYDEKWKMHLGQAARHGYVVIAPEWTTEQQRKYEYSAREHAAVMYSLRDACKRFAIDTDKVFLSGHSVGGDAVWDIGLAHPDLWAGMIPIVATAGKFVERYGANGRLLPMYFIGGELDGDKINNNGARWDDYFRKATINGFDVMVVDYLGRGHENYQEEIHRVFEWMKLHRREFFPREFSCVSMRPWDNFFWFVEVREYPAKAMVVPANWPPPHNTSAISTEGKITKANGVTVTKGGKKATVWLAPEMVNFAMPVIINGRSQNIAPSAKVLLEDVRTRGDRQHPFWAKVEL